MENFLDTVHNENIDDNVDDNQIDINQNQNQDDDDNQNDDNQNQNQNDDDNDDNQNDNSDGNNNIEEAENEFNTALDLINNGDEDLRKEFLLKYKGEDFDNEGNIVDKNGNIIKSREDIVKDLASEEDVLYNDNGDVVDEKGNIVKTKEEVQAEKIVANQIAKKLGYEFEDENGKIKLYSEGEAGIEEFANDLSDYQLEQKLEAHYNSNPVLTEVAKHLLAGGDLKSFKEPIDYSSVDVSKLSKEDKQNFIKKSLIEDGMSESRAEKFAKSAKDIDEETKEALEVLTTKEKERAEQRDAKIQQQQQARQKEIETYWNNVQNTISKGKLKNIEIPNNDRDKFFQYLSQPVEGNKSKYAIEKEKKTLEDTLQEAYYQFKGYSLNDIVKDKVNTSRVMSLKQRIKEAEKRKSSDNSNRMGNRSKPMEINLENIQE